MTATVSAADFRQQFAEAIRAAGLTPPAEIVADGAIHRFAPNGRPSDKAGFYILHGDGVPAGSFGDWRTSKTYAWRADLGRKLTRAEETAHRARVKEMRRKREAEEVKRHTEARQEAQQLWGSAKDANDTHPYLKRKGVKAHGLKVDGQGRLLVPLKIGAEWHSLQTIAGDGKKLFLTGGRVAGAYFLIGTKDQAEKDRLLCVAEGFATAASIHEAAGYTVVAAFNAGNLMPVAQYLKKQFPGLRLLLCADDDAATQGNPGLTKAKEAARVVGGLLAVPHFGADRPKGISDFNDLAQLRGMQAVKAAIDAAVNGVAVIDEANEERAAIAGEGHSPVLPRSDSQETEEGDEIRPLGYTDDAITLAFSANHVDSLRYVPEWGWAEWDGSRWHIVPDVKILDLARQVCRAIAKHCAMDPALSVPRKENFSRAILSAKTVAAVAKLSCGDPRHLSQAKDWDSDLWLFNTPGGTVELRTGKLRAHSQRDRIAKISNATPRGDCPLWKAFLDQITAGSLELQGYLRRVVGYALAGDPSEEVVIFLYGSGGNGKGTFLDAIQYAFGEYATTASMDTFTETQGERHPADLAKLAGKRLVIAQEVDEGKRWDEARLKSLTGRDVISARFMRKDYFDFRPQFSLLIAGNHKPALKTVDDAIRRRLHLVPFEVSIPQEKRNKDLKTALRSEADGILAWAVRGCLEWQQQGLNPPAAVIDATKDYLEDEDVFGQWVKFFCLVGRGYSEPSGLLYASWRRWKENRGEHPGSQKKFSATLAGRGFELDRTDSVRKLTGIRLTDEERIATKALLDRAKADRDLFERGRDDA